VVGATPVLTWDSREGSTSSVAGAGDVSDARAGLLVIAADSGEDRVGDRGDGRAGVIGIVAAEASFCRGPSERGCSRVVRRGRAAAPLPLLGALAPAVRVGLSPITLVALAPCQAGVAPTV
jgi:hypothetical protein